MIWAIKKFPMSTGNMLTQKNNSEWFEFTYTTETKETSDGLSFKIGVSYSPPSSYDDMSEYTGHKYNVTLTKSGGTAYIENFCGVGGSFSKITSESSTTDFTLLTVASFSVDVNGNSTYTSRKNY